MAEKVDAIAVEEHLPVLSIIIPIFNTDKYLERCLRSIQNQSFADFEAILVDDGSADQSALICDVFAHSDSRFKVKHLVNGGVGHARNVGLGMAQGAYVTFADSDDWLAPEAFATYVNAFSDKTIDAVKAGYIREYVEAGVVQTVTNHKTKTFSDKSDLFRHLEATEYYSFIWNICIKRDVIGTLRFHEDINWLEDHLFCYQLYERCHKVVVLPQTTYHYLIRSSVKSLSNVGNPKIIAIATQREFEYKKMLNKGKYRDVDEQIETLYCHNVHRLVDALYAAPVSRIERRSYLHFELKTRKLLFKEECIYFSKLMPFFVKDFLLKTLYWIRRQ